MAWLNYQKKRDINLKVKSCKFFWGPRLLQVCCYSDLGETWHRETTRRGPTGLVLEDIRLTSEEASCLEKERWLLDQLILFFLTYLCSIKWSHYKDDIEIIGPSVAQMLQMYNNDDWRGRGTTSTFEYCGWKLEPKRLAIAGTWWHVGTCFHDAREHA